MSLTCDYLIWMEPQIRVTNINYNWWVITCEECEPWVRTLQLNIIIDFPGYHCYHVFINISRPYPWPDHSLKILIGHLFICTFIFFHEAGYEYGNSLIEESQIRFMHAGTIIYLLLHVVKIIPNFLRLKTEMSVDLWLWTTAASCHCVGPAAGASHTIDPRGETAKPHLIQTDLQTFRRARSPTTARVCACKKCKSSSINMF